MSSCVPAGALPVTEQTENSTTACDWCVDGDNDMSNNTMFNTTFRCGIDATTTVGLPSSVYDSYCSMVPGDSQSQHSPVPTIQLTEGLVEVDTYHDTHILANQNVYSVDDDCEHCEEKLDSSEKNFDEESYIRSILDNAIYNDFSVVDSQTDGNFGDIDQVDRNSSPPWDNAAIDLSLSEYEQNILNKYLREFNDEERNDGRNSPTSYNHELSSLHHDQPHAFCVDTLDPCDSLDQNYTATAYPSDSWQDPDVCMRHLSVSSSSLSPSPLAFQPQPDTSSQSTADICDSSRRICFKETISKMNPINQHHQTIPNEYDHTVINNNINNHMDQSDGMINRLSDGSKPHRGFKFHRLFSRNRSILVAVIVCVCSILLAYVKLSCFD